MGYRKIARTMKITKRPLGELSLRRGIRVVYLFKCRGRSRYNRINRHRASYGYIKPGERRFLHTVQRAHKPARYAAEVVWYGSTFTSRAPCSKIVISPLSDP